MTRNFLLVLLAVVISSVLMFPQAASNSYTETSPTLSNKHYDNLNIRDQWDLQLSFDLNVATGAAGNAGAEFDGTYLYTTRWASNLIHKYDMAGNLVEEFSIPGVSGLRDLAFDGTYMYGGAAANTIYQMDFTAKTLIGTISSPVAVRFIAYDENNDAFWCGTWSDPPTLVSRAGTNLGSFATGLAGQYGAAYDNVSPGGPFLWMFDQGGGVCPGSMMIIQYDIATGTPTGVAHDACTDLTDGIAGGLFSTVDYVAGFFSIGGVMQSNSGLDDTFFIYEVIPSIIVGPGPAENPNPANGATDVDVNADIAWDNAAGATSIEILFGELGNMTSVYSGAPITTFDVGQMDYNTTYAWKVNQTDGSGTTISPTWTFTTAQDPNLNTLFFDDFESGTGLWTIINDGGTCVWEIFMPPYPNSYALPCGGGCGGVFAADADECGSGTTVLTTARVTNPIDATGSSNVTLYFDNDFNVIGSADEGYVEVSTDGGTTWTTVWSSIGIDILNTTEVVDLSAYDGMTFMLQFRSVQPGWDWWWAIDNVLVQGSGGGPVGFADDFDSYTVGQQLACQNPVDWTTWSLDPCNATEDPFISDNYSWSGSNSVVIVQNNDLVHIFDAAGPKTSGTWYASFAAYIPAGKAGYFNTLAVFNGTSSDWAMECYFDLGGAGRLLSNSTVFANFTWPEDTWFQMIVQVDLDADQAQLMLATNPSNITTISTWQWTTGGGGTHALSLDANDLFGATANDEMYVDHYSFGDVMPDIIPVEFSTFTATANNGTVVLNWSTASETNNRGFEVQRSSGEDFTTIGFVGGNGTSTQSHSYSYVDNTVTTAQYSYRLKQIDFDGTFAYSNVVEVNVTAPMVYALDQNYPNPFNPTTQINFSLAADSKVTLKIFDVLGQEVAALINGSLLAGPHVINFNASNLTSGVYLYRIDATGVDGSNFTAVKKMILTK